MKHSLNRVGYPAVFSVAEARSQGASDYEVRSGRRLVPVTWGVRLDTESHTDFPLPLWADERWIAEAQFLLAMAHRHPGVVACRETAARVFGWPLPARMDDSTLHLATAETDKRIRRKRVALHRLKDFSAFVWLQLPVLSPLATFVQLAPLLEVSALVRIGDAAVGDWHGPPLFTLDSLREHLDSTRYLRARPRLEAAFELIREGVDSPMETDLRLWAISRDLPEPEVHPAVHCRTIDAILHPDLGYRKEQLALEYEGDHHRTSESQWATDLDRVNALRVEGWTVLRVTKRTNRWQLERDIRHHLGLPSAEHRK